MEHSWSYNANKLRNGLLRLFLEVELKILACDPIFFRAGFIDGDCARVPHFKWCRNTEYSWRYNANWSFKQAFACIFRHKHSALRSNMNQCPEYYEWASFPIPSTSLMQEIIPIHDELMKLQYDMSTKMIIFDAPNSTTLWQAFLAFRSPALIITT